MPVDSETGLFSIRSGAELENDLISALRDNFGDTQDVTPGSPEKKLLEAAQVLPTVELEQTAQDIYRQQYVQSATGQSLQKHLDDLLGFEKQVPKRASGTVDLSFNEEKTSDPVFNSGDIVFVDVGGRKYDLTADVNTPSALFDSNETGTDSETLDGSEAEDIAQKFTLDDEQFVQAVKFKANHNSGTPTVTVRIETHDDTNNEPTGDVADSRLEETGVEPTDSEIDFVPFTEGAYLDSGTYWLVITHESDSADLDGGTGGSADQVKFFDGSSWTLSSNVENLNAEVLEGGLASVEAQLAGDAQNISPDSLASNPSFNSSSASTTFSEDVETFTNNKEFTGGQDEETDEEYFRRFRNSIASAPSSSQGGLAQAFIDAQIGVDEVFVDENTGDSAKITDDVLQVDNTGTASQSVDGSNQDAIAIKFTVAKNRFIEQVKAKLNTDSDLNVDVRIETHDSNNDEPSGTLADSNLELTGGDFDATNVTTFNFGDGARLSTGTYWVVFAHSSGSGTFDGEDPSDIVDNDGFETYSSSPGAPDDWSKFGDNATIRQETTNVNSGSNSVEIEATDASGGDRGIEQRLGQTEFIVGITYDVQVQARTDGNTGEIPTLFLYNETDDVVEDTADGTDGGTSFEQLSFTFEPEPDKQYAIRLGQKQDNATSGDVVYFDDVTVDVEPNTVKVDTDTSSSTSWSQDSNVDLIRSEVDGGLPPHSLRAIIEGAVDAGDIATVLWENKPAGIETDGAQTGTHTRRDNSDVTMRYEEPTVTDIVFDVTVEKTDRFVQDADAVRDVIMDYVGGTDTDGDDVDGELSFGDDVVRTRIFQQLQDIVGVFDITRVRLGTKSSFPNATDLTSSETSNIGIDSKAQANISEPSTDINVTLNDA